MERKRTFRKTKGIIIKRQSKWVCLPDIVLLQIYSYLPDTDRFHVSLVCKSWSRMFDAAYLWKMRTFDLKDCDPRRASQKATVFAQKYGSFMKRLDITCRVQNRESFRCFQQNFTAFLSKLTRSVQLKEFIMPRLQFYRYWRNYDGVRDRLVDTLSRFLRYQKTLKMLNLSGAQLDISNGCKILEVVGRSSGEHLEVLLLEDFFHRSLPLYLFTRFIKAMSVFTNLLNISINYNCLSNVILHAMAESMGSKLEKLTISANKNDPHFHQITSVTWRFVSGRCPKLSVELWLDSIGKAIDILPMLTQYMPLELFDLWYGYEEDLNLNLARTLGRITETFSSTLVHLSLVLDNNNDNIDQALLDLILSCLHLKNIHVNAKLLTTTIENICFFQLQGRISLCVLHVMFRHLCNEGWTKLLDIKEKYLQMIESRRLDFSFARHLPVNN